METQTLLSKIEVGMIYRISATNINYALFPIATFESSKGTKLLEMQSRRSEWNWTRNDDLGHIKHRDKDSGLGTVLPK